MGVYVKSMDVPQTCEECNLESFCDLWVDTKRMCGEDFTDSKSRIKATIRHPNCPLVEVKPHGRLIDADALPTYPKPIGKLMMYDGECVYTQTTIDNAPTIIEADESDMDSFIRIFEEDDDEDGMDSFIQILKD